MKKELFDLTVDDLLQNNIWYFPMDEGESDTFVATADESQNSNHQTIIATKFIARTGKEFIGYVYFDLRKEIKYLQPVIVLGEDNLNLWTGIQKPDDQKITRLASVFGRDLFPLTFETLIPDEGETFSGTLLGIYFSDDNGLVDSVSF